MRRGKKLARRLNARIKGYEDIIKNNSNEAKAFTKPGGSPGDYAKRYGVK